MVSVYGTGKHNRFFAEELNNLFIKLSFNNDNNFYVIAGDFNAKQSTWGNNKNNNNGTMLHKWMLENDLKFRVGLLYTQSPSFPRVGSFLDLALIDSRINVINALNNRLLTYMHFGTNLPRTTLRWETFDHAERTDLNSYCTVERKVTSPALYIYNFSS